mmetsp:Transcript_128330/g.256315  ORF Transcript_128330/g.256315 Transcript_128330/m.256315 type:complete len:86 (-) Transcript_128330:30-287(-)
MQQNGQRLLLMVRRTAGVQTCSLAPKTALSCPYGEESSSRLRYRTFELHSLPNQTQLQPSLIRFRTAMVTISFEVCAVGRCVHND